MRLALFVPASVLLAGALFACDRTSEAPCTGTTATVPPAPPAASTVSQASAAAAAPSTPSPAPSPSHARASPLGPAPPPPPAAFVNAAVAVENAIAAGDYAGADRQLDAAAQAAGSDFHLRFVVARYRATRFAYSNDLERAAAALVSAIPEVAKHPESPDEFSAHNSMMILRVAQGDPAAALAEDDQATLAAARGTWAPDDRETLAYLKDRWHRAYLTRMLAETRSGSVRQALVQYAQASLDDYRARARELGSNEESIAVLEAYFGALDGNREAALKAAKKVDPAKDEDLEDLYLVVVGLEAGGDHAAAERVRQVMRAPSDVHFSHPILLRWLDHDAKRPADKAFTPWHPQ